MNRLSKTLLAAVILCASTTLRAQQTPSEIVPPYQNDEKETAGKLKVKADATSQSKLTEEFRVAYLAQVKKNADIEATLNAEILQKRYKGDAAFAKLLQKVIFDRIVAIQTLALNPPGTRNTELMKTISKRADSIIEAYSYAAKNRLMANDKVLPESDNSRFGYAVRNRTQLKLSLAQTDSLISHSQKLIELKRNGQNSKEYERKVLPAVLNDDQYTQLLIMGSRKLATTWALRTWKNILDRGLNEGLDSAKSVNAIYNYNIALLVKKERFGDDSPKPSVSMKSLETQEPEALRRIRQATRYKNPVPDKTANATKFTW